MSELKEQIQNAIKVNGMQAGLSSYDIDKLLSPLSDDIMQLVQKELDHEFE